MKHQRIAYVAVALIGCVPALFVAAQPPGLTTKLLLRTTFADDAMKEALVLSAELAPMTTTGRHIHPGDEYGTVLEGMLEVHIDGQEPRVIHAGEAYHNPRGLVHETRNLSQARTRLVSTFIIDKGQPLVQPVK
jgi:quercetin dioxygenase-like cupin family protein